MSEPNPVEIKLTREEAIVLFDFLGRFNEDEPDQAFEDQAEQRVLWNIECDLEKQLHEPFASNYSDILAQARAKVRDQS